MSILTYLLTYFYHITRTTVSEYVCLLQSVKKIVEASEQELALCPGLGPQKANSFSTFLTLSLHKYLILTTGKYLLTMTTYLLKNGVLLWTMKTISFFHK